MAIIFDFVIIVIIALFTFLGYKQGLVKSAIKILSFFIAIIVSLVLYKPLSNVIISNTSIDDNIKNAIIEKIKPEGIEKDEEITIEGNMNFDILKGTTSNTIEGIADVFTVKLIETITLLMIFIIIKIVLRFVSVLTDIITKIPLLKQVNKLGGLIYGVLRGVILVYTILLVVYLITPLLSKTVVESIDKSIITKALYNNNIILNILM